MAEVEQTTGARRLILGFDAGCTTCSELAKRIEKAVGGKLEVRSLRDPEMEKWRRQALGSDAPWTPTLVELEDGEAKAWIGTRMGVYLSYVLGPLTTWRVMQALGETRSVGTNRKTLPAPGKGVSVISRGRFVKGLCGSALACGLLVGTPSLALAAEDELNEKALIEAFSVIEQIPNSVIARGPRAVSLWLERKAQGIAGGYQQRGVVDCAESIVVAIVANAIPITKILKIRAAIKAVGGARNFAAILQYAYKVGRRRGYSKWESIKYACREAAEASGKDIYLALLALFALDNVRDDCF